MFQRSILILAAAISLPTAGGANAQVGLSTKPNYDLIEKADRIDEAATGEQRLLRQAGIEALQAKNYPVAEKVFGDLLLRNANAKDAHFMMGLAKVGLEKWEEARGVLEIAAARDPQRPEPKTRLGLTYVKLGDTDSAMKQRAQLAALDQVCKGACDDATWIADGLTLLDQALASPRTTAAASLAPSTVDAAAFATLSKDFDPADYSLVSFSDIGDLYSLLTQEGRCPPNKMAEPRQPCALILYTPADDTDDTLAANFKPVFKVVSRASIWAIHDKKLQKIRIEDLYFDEERIIGKKQSEHRSVALIGNAENKTNCEQARPCLGNLVVQDMFRMYSNMPDSVVEVIWGSGMKDSATVRIR